MDYREIIDDAKKYHYFLTTPTKIISLGSDNNKSVAMKLALKKLEPIIEKLIGKKLTFVRIKYIKNAYEEEKNSDKNIKLIGGPIVFVIEKGEIMSRTSIVNKPETSNNLFYLSVKYIKKNMDNIAKDIKKVIEEYNQKKLTNHLFDVNIL